MIQKYVLTEGYGDLESELNRHPVTKYKQLKRQGILLKTELQEFENKDDYKNLVIVQHAVALRHNVENKVLFMQRKPEEGDQSRITKGGSILISSSPLKMPDQIIRKKLGEVLQTQPRHNRFPDYVTMNKRGNYHYVFFVHVLRIRQEVRTFERTAKKRDESVQLLAPSTAIERLKSGEQDKSMEIKIAKALFPKLYAKKKERR